MQTFLPYQSYSRTAKCLDYRRLGKQRVEVLQILRTLHSTDESVGWRNHPAVLMWADYVESLVTYGIAVCNEWLDRGYNDTCLAKIEEFSNWEEGGKPPWLTEEFCLAHRSNLLRKDPEYYGQFNWDVPNDLPYIWPTKQEN